MKIINWVRQNKLTTLLLIVVLYLLLQKSSIQPIPLLSRNNAITGMAVSDVAVSKMAAPGFGGVMPFQEVAPQPDVKNRMVVQNSSLSLQVKNVSNSLTEIKDFAVKNNGYMVNSSLSRPEEAAYGEISIRVPENKLDETLNYLRTLAVKVVSENLSGYDVTDQYVDNDARLAILEKNKARFEEIMNKAVNVDEILKVQQEIFNIQTQIDSIKGQQKYLENTSKTVAISISLSTDEFALPYAPETTFRPEVIFKQAVRSLVLQLRSLGAGVIWLGVYAIVWVPALLIFLFVRRKFFK